MEEKKRGGCFRTAFMLILIFILALWIVGRCDDYRNTRNTYEKKLKPVETKVQPEVKPEVKPERLPSGYIGNWILPITSQISQTIQLFYDERKGVYYIKEKNLTNSKIDSLGAVLSINADKSYSVEYAKPKPDNYKITNKETVLWLCTGYETVRCKATIDMDKLASTYEKYKGSASSKPKSGDVKQISDKEKTKYYNWTKELVKKCVFNPESLVFPDIKNVKLKQKQEVYSIEYNVSGKDLYNKAVTYPVNVVFTLDEDNEPSFESISLE